MQRPGGVGHVHVGDGRGETGKKLSNCHRVMRGVGLVHGAKVLCLRRAV